MNTREVVVRARDVCVRTPNTRNAFGERDVRERHVTRVDVAALYRNEPLRCSELARFVRAHPTQRRKLGPQLCLRFRSTRLVLLQAELV